jgi:hypothetical protein
MICRLLEPSSLEALILDVGKIFLIADYVVPYKPSATIRMGAILFPRTKVMTTYKHRAGCYMKDGK